MVNNITIVLTSMSLVNARFDGEKDERTQSVAWGEGIA